MFYCESCRIKKSWPQSLFGSYGACEICKQVGPCNDVASAHLPDPRPKYFTRDPEPWVDAFGRNDGKRRQECGRFDPRPEYDAPTS